MHPSYLTITKTGCFGKDLTGVQAVPFESISKFNLIIGVMLNSLHCLFINNYI